MIDLFQGAMSTSYLTPNKGRGLLTHLGAPPGGLARPPLPASLQAEQDHTAPGKTTEDLTRHAVDSLLQSARKTRINAPLQPVLNQRPTGYYS